MRSHVPRVGRAARVGRANVEPTSSAGAACALSSSRARKLALGHRFACRRAAVCSWRLSVRVPGATGRPVRAAGYVPGHLVRPPGQMAQRAAEWPSVRLGSNYGVLVCYSTPICSSTPMGATALGLATPSCSRPSGPDGPPGTPLQAGGPAPDACAPKAQTLAAPRPKIL